MIVLFFVFAAGSGIIGKRSLHSRIIYVFVTRGVLIINAFVTRGVISMSAHCEDSFDFFRRFCLVLVAVVVNPNGRFFEDPGILKTALP